MATWLCVRSRSNTHTCDYQSVQDPNWVLWHQYYLFIMIKTSQFHIQQHAGICLQSCWGTGMCLLSAIKLMCCFSKEIVPGLLTKYHKNSTLSLHFSWVKNLYMAKIKIFIKKYAINSNLGYQILLENHPSNQPDDQFSTILSLA